MHTSRLGRTSRVARNAGCSVGYFDHLARALATAGFQAIAISMRGVQGSLGSLGGTTLHDLAGDVVIVGAVGGYPHLISGERSSQTRAGSMTDIILHHYEISPYSEKVRI